MELVVYLFEEIRCIFGRCDYRNNVLFFKNKITVCNIRVIVSLDGTNKNITTKCGNDLAYRHSDKGAVFGDEKTPSFDAAQTLEAMRVRDAVLKAAAVPGETIKF